MFHVPRYAGGHPRLVLALIFGGLLALAGAVEAMQPLMNMITFTARSRDDRPCVVLDPFGGSGTTLIAAENGPVIEADDTGLVLRLSDRVIRDIARRIGLPAAPEAAPEAAPVQPTSATVQWLDAALLGDIDAWDLQREGEWLRFLAHRPGPQGARRYRRHASGGGIIAETPGPVLGLLSLGAGADAGSPVYGEADAVYGARPGRARRDEVRVVPVADVAGTPDTTGRKEA